MRSQLTRLLACLFFLGCSEARNSAENESPRLVVDCHKKTSICTGDQRIRIIGHRIIVIRLPVPHSKYCVIRTPPLKVYAPQAPNKYIYETKFFDPVSDVPAAWNLDEDLLRNKFSTATELVIDTRSLYFPKLGPGKSDLYIFAVSGTYQILLSDDLYTDREKPVYDVKLLIDFQPNHTP